MARLTPPSVLNDGTAGLEVSDGPTSPVIGMMIMSPELPLALALPLLAPPAASTSPTRPEVLLLPVWPVAPAAPLVLVALPVLVTTFVAPPLMLVVAVRMPSP